LRAEELRFGERPSDRRIVVGMARDEDAGAGQQGHHAVGSDVDAAVEPLEVARLHRGHHEAAEAPVGALDPARQADEPHARRAADQRLGDVQAGVGVLLVEAEVGPVGEAHARRRRVVGVVGDEAVGADHEQGTDVGQRLEPAAHRGAEPRVVRGQAWCGGQGVAQAEQGEVDRLDGARRLLGQHVGEGGRGPLPLRDGLAPGVPQLERDEAGDAEEQEPDQADEPALRGCANNGPAPRAQARGPSVDPEGPASRRGCCGSAWRPRG
jgi:hypothetical protein